MRILRILPAALLVCGSAACNASRSVTPPDASTPGGAGDQTPAVPLPAVSFRVLAHEQYTGISDKRRVVLRDSADWAAAWTEWTSIMRPTPPLPQVDFSTEMVVLVSQGAQYTGGYVIRVTGVGKQGTAYSVAVQSQRPGSNCVVTTSVTDPAEAIAVPRIEGPVSFAESDTTASCG